MRVSKENCRDDNNGHLKLMKLDSVLVFIFWFWFGSARVPGISFFGFSGLEYKSTQLWEASRSFFKQLINKLKLSDVFP